MYLEERDDHKEHDNNVIVVGNTYNLTYHCDGDPEFKLG